VLGHGFKQAEGVTSADEDGFGFADSFPGVGSTMQRSAVVSHCAEPIASGLRVGFPVVQSVGHEHHFPAVAKKITNGLFGMVQIPLPMDAGAAEARAGGGNR